MSSAAEEWTRRVCLLIEQIGLPRAWGSSTSMQPSKVEGTGGLRDLRRFELGKKLFQVSKGGKDGS